MPYDTLPLYAMPTLMLPLDYARRRFSYYDADDMPLITLR